MISREQAQRIRAEMELHAETLTDETALEVPEMFPVWTPRDYEGGERVRYGGEIVELYKCIQAHPANETYTPDAAVSLWAKVINEGVPEWVQPDSTNPYMKGDKVTHNGQTWISDIDYNVFEPGVAGWSVIA